MRRVLALAAVCFALSVPKAEAAFITGAVTLDFDPLLISLNTGGTDFSVATTLLNGGGLVTQGAEAGDFDDLIAGTSVATTFLAPFEYANAAQTAEGIGPTPGPAFFTFATTEGFATFNVTSFTLVGGVPTFEQGLFIVLGDGYWTGDGFDPTLGVFTFSATRSGNEAAGTLAWEAGGTFIATGQPFDTPVPEPASMLLLGSGLVGVAASARRRLRRKA